MYYDIKFKFPPEHFLAQMLDRGVVKEGVRYTFSTDHTYRSISLSTSVFTETIDGSPRSRSCEAHLDENTGKFEIVVYRHRQGLARLVDIFDNSSEPKVKETVRKGVDFNEAFAYVKQFEEECKGQGLPVRENPNRIATHYSFVSAFLADGNPVEEMEPEAFRNRAPEQKQGCPHCNCRKP